MDEAQKPSVHRDIIPPHLHVPVVAMLLALATLFAWTYFDRYGLQHDLEIAKLKVDIQQLADQQSGAFVAAEGAADGSGAAAEGVDGGRWQGEWRSVTTDDGAYAMDLPPGTRLVQSEGYVYVMADPPSPDAELPYMAVKIATGVDRQGYRPDPSSSVMLDIGRNAYWLYTWEFMEWEPFARVVASFKVVE